MAGISLLAGLITAVAAVVVAIVAVRQLPLLVQQLKNAEEHRQTERKHQKEELTLSVCTLYNIDPTLHQIKRRIYEARGKGDKWEFRDIPSIRREIENLLNYLDVIAIGVHQKIYLTEIVYDNLFIVVEHAVSRFLLTDPENKFANKAHFPHLLALREEFKNRSDELQRKGQEHALKISKTTEYTSLE